MPMKLLILGGGTSGGRGSGASANFIFMGAGIFRFEKNFLQNQFAIKISPLIHRDELISEEWSKGIG